MADTLNLATRKVATLLSTPGGRRYTDPEIKEYVALAFDEILKRLAENGINQLRSQVDFTLPAGVTVVGPTTTPALPSDFVRPESLWEQQNGNWCAMRIVRDHIPFNIDKEERLTWWNFRDGSLYFLGANQNVPVRMQYIANIPSMVKPGDIIDYPSLLGVVSYQAAAIGAAVGEQQTAQFFEDKANKLLQSLVNIDTHMDQQRPFRRIRRRMGLSTWRY